MESASLPLCRYGICQSYTLSLWNLPVFHSVTMESASLPLCHYGICQSSTVAMESASLPLCHYGICQSFTLESASLSLCHYGICQSFTLLLLNLPVFHSVAMESASLPLCCYGICQSSTLSLWLACGLNMASKYSFFHGVSSVVFWLAETADLYSDLYFSRKSGALLLFDTGIAGERQQTRAVWQWEMMDLILLVHSLFLYGVVWNILVRSSLTWDNEGKS